MTSDGQLLLFDYAERAESSPVARAQREGENHQRRLAERGARKASGSFYTPPWVVDGLLSLTLGPLLAARSAQGPDAVADLRILDPACGSGNFLTAAAQFITEALQALGTPRRVAREQAFSACVIGVDIDHEAANSCRENLGDAGGRVNRNITVGDALLMAVPPGFSPLSERTYTPTWDQVIAEADCPNGGFDLVIGNPPFLNQLGSDTSRESQYHAALKARFGSAVEGYVDPAILFLLLATRLARADGGVVSLIQPQSMLATRDAMPARSAVAESGTLTGMWIATSRVFDAAVDVCAPIIRRDVSDRSVAIFAGRAFEVIGTQSDQPSPTSWAALLAATKGLPEISASTDGVLADLAGATADFRDQYYGLAPHVVDEADGDRPRLITSGSIDPANLLWGRRPTKFNKVTYQYPRIEIADLDPTLQSWAERRLVPKILVATQTKVLEVVVDEDGTLLPSVPVITVTGAPDTLYRIAALITSPPATLIAAQRHLGAALSSNALKLSAREVLALPLPEHEDPWVEAGEYFRRASSTAEPDERRTNLLRSAELMCAAFGIADPSPLLEWWTARLPKDRDAA